MASIAKIPRHLQCALLCAVLCGGATLGRSNDAQAQDTPVYVSPAEQPIVARFERDIARRHDRGLMVHAEAGLGYGSGPGLGACGTLGVGWLPWEDMALSVEAWGMWGGAGGVASVGPGLTYFFPESALHLRVASGVAATALQDAAVDLSVGGSFGLGITPYITPNASLGLGLVLAGQLGDLDGNGASAAGFMVGLSLSWTLN